MSAIKWKEKFQLVGKKRRIRIWTVSPWRLWSLLSLGVSSRTKPWTSCSEFCVAPPRGRSWTRWTYWDPSKPQLFCHERLQEAATTPVHPASVVKGPAFDSPSGDFYFFSHTSKEWLHSFSPLAVLLHKVTLLRLVSLGFFCVKSFFSSQEIT